MTDLEAALRKVGSELLDARVRFALVGGLAVSARTEPRFTRDADLAVAVADDAEAEALIRRLRSQGYEVGSLVERGAVGRLATARLDSPGAPGTLVIDLLFASSGIESEIVAAAEPIELLDQFTIAVARTGDLLALKVLSRDDVARPQDLVDLRSLLRVASPEEVTRAREALALISARGYSRGRDLAGDLEVLLSSQR